jgi:hypothetical protein
MERLNQIILVIGRRGEGKSYYTLNKLLPRLKMKKLIVDMFDHPDYSAYGKSLSLEQLNRFNTGSKNGRIYGYEIDEILSKINSVISNTVIVFEDSRRYVEPSIQKDFRKLIIEHRNKNIDLIFQFHNLSDVPPYLAAMYNVVVMFRTNDNLSKRMEKFSNWESLEKAQSAVRLISDKVKAKTPATPFYNPYAVRMQ